MGRKFTIFALFYFVLEGKFQVQAPRGAYFRRGNLTECFLRYDFRGPIFGGAYTWRGLFSEFYGMFAQPDFVFNTETFCSLYTIMFQGSQPPLQWQQLQWDILHPLDMSKRVQVFFVTARLSFQGTHTQTHLAKLQDQ